MVGLLLGSLPLLALAFARPEVTSTVPISQSAIILALDDSGSMCSTDVFPDRFGRHQRTARGFVDSEPTGVRIGLVVFSGYAQDFAGRADD